MRTKSTSTPSTPGSSRARAARTTGSTPSRSALHSVQSAPLRVQRGRAVSCRELAAPCCLGEIARGVDGAARGLDLLTARGDPGGEQLQPIREQVALRLEVRELVSRLVQLDRQPLEPAGQLGRLRVGGQRVALKLCAGTGDVTLPPHDRLEGFAGLAQPMAHFLAPLTLCGQGGAHLVQRRIQPCGLDFYRGALLG